MSHLDYVCFNGFNGYSASARNNILALEHSGKYDVKVTPLDGITFKGDESYFLKTLIDKPNNDKQLQIFHVIPDMQTRVKRKMYSAGFGIFETENPPTRWYDILSKNNLILCPSSFNQRIFAAKCDKPTYLIPHCIDFNQFNLDIKSSRTDKFTFLFFGTWKERKGYKELLDAYYSEFTYNDNVRLVIKTDKPQMAEQYILQYKKKYKFAPSIEVINDNMTDEELPSFIKSAHCMVNCHKGEGFYVPGLMAMALGVPLIITDYSGCTDYANDNTAIMLKPEGFVKYPCLDNIPQFKDCSWAYVSVKQLRSKMRSIYESPNSYNRMTERAYELVSNKFTYEDTVKAFNYALKDSKIADKVEKLAELCY